MNNGIFYNTSLIYTFVFWLFTIFVWFIYAPEKRNRDILNPIYLITILYYGYSLGGGLAVEAGNFSQEIGAIDKSYLSPYYIHCIIGLVFINIGYGIGIKSGLTVKINSKISYKTPIRKYILYLISISLVFLFYDNIVELTIPTKHSNYEQYVLEQLSQAMTSESLNIIKYFSDRFPLTIIMCGLMVVIFYEKNIMLRIVGIGFLFSILYTHVLIGFRQQLMFIASFPLIFYHYRVSKLKPKTIAVLFISGYLVINIMQVWRYIEISDIAAALRIVSERPEIFFPNNISEFIGPTHYYMKMLEKIEFGSFDLQYFGVLANSALMLLPRALFDREMTGVDKLAENINADVYSVGGGYGTFLIFDPYVSFGIIGIAIFMFIAGLLVSFLYNTFLKHKENDHVLIIYAVVFNIIAFQFNRSALFSMPKYLIMGLLPIMALIIMEKIMIPVAKKKTISII